MSAQGIAARMVVKLGQKEAKRRVDLRAFKWDRAVNRCRTSAFTHHCARATLWRAVSTALGRMEASHV